MIKEQGIKQVEIYNLNDDKAQQYIEKFIE